VGLFKNPARKLSAIEQYRLMQLRLHDKIRALRGFGHPTESQAEAKKVKKLRFLSK
jgi:hypothetical protein